MNILVSLLLIALLTHDAESNFDFEKLNQNGTKECFASYLKSISLIDKSYPSDPTPLDQLICENAISELSDEFKSNVKSLSFAAKRNANEFDDCVLKMFEKYNLMNLQLKGITFSLHSKSNSEETDSSDRKLFVELALDVCDKERNKEKFQSIKAKIPQIDHDSLCNKNFLFENQLIDLKEWNITKANSNVTDCDKANKYLEDFVDMGRLNGLNATSSFFGMRAPSAADCIYNKFKSIMLNLNRKAAEVLLTNYKLSAANLERLLEIYNKLENQATEITLECLTLALTIAGSD